MSARILRKLCSNLNFSLRPSCTEEEGSTLDPFLGVEKLGHTPSTAGTFRRKFRKDPGNALRAFPGIPLQSTAGIPQTLQFKAFEGSRAFPEFSPPPVRLGMPLFSEVVPERASQSCRHGIPSSTGGIAEKLTWSSLKGVLRWGPFWW